MKRSGSRPIGATFDLLALPDARTLLLIHNPRCSKSRAAKALLEERGVPFELRLYLEDPLTRDELAELRKQLGRPALEWTRRGEPAFGASGLGPDSADAALLDAIAKHPELLERPILVRGDKAVVGRPPEKVLELLSAAARK
jgi:arsenate reductase (glutaredoxin)